MKNILLPSSHTYLINASVLAPSIICLKIYALIKWQRVLESFPGLKFIYILSILFDMLGRFKATDANRLRDEYKRLVNGLALSGNLAGMSNAKALLLHSEHLCYILL